MPDVAQVKAIIPRDLKRRAFAVLALREEKFNGWLRRELEALLHEAETVERHDYGRQKNTLAGSEDRT